MERLPKRWLIAVVALFLFAGSAMAVPVCTNDTNNHQYICHDTFGDPTPLLGEFERVLPLPKFDPSLGALMRVEFNLSSHLDGSATLTNYNSTLKYYQVTLSEYVTLTDPTDTLVAYNVPLFVTPAIAPIILPGAISVPGSSSRTLTGSADASGPGIVTFTSPFTAEQQATYIGSGNINFVVKTIGNSGFTGAGSTGFISSVYTSGIAEVIYTYSDVPEPATMLLIGSSLLLVGFTRKAKVLSA